MDANTPINPQPRSPISSLLTPVYQFINCTLLPPFDWPAFETAWEIYRDARIANGRADIDALPVVACLAASGNVEQVLPTAAAWTLYILAARIFDDVADDEGDESGLFARRNAPSPLSACLFAVSAANASLTHLDESSGSRDIVATFSHTLALAVKSEHTQPPLSQLSVETYFETIAAKTGIVFATGMWAGSRTAVADKNITDSLHKFGLHLGMMTQILDDCVDLKADLANQVWTLPLIYASSQKQHPAHQQLTSLLAQPAPNAAWIDEIVSLLDTMNAVPWSLQIAEVHRQEAVSLIEDLPHHRDLLRHYVTPKHQ